MTLLPRPLVKQTTAFRRHSFSWKRNIKISPMDIQVFKDEASWIRLTLLPPLNLTDSDISLTHNHVIDNLDLDKIQRGWLLQDPPRHYSSAQGKSIVTTH
jgi:hypothetical protein